MFGGVVDRITQRRVPLALGSLELSRHVERIVAVAPALLAVGTQDEHDEISSKINAQIERLDEFFGNLRRFDIDADTLKEIESDLNWLRLNLTNLDAMIAGQIASAEYMEEMVTDVSKSRLAINQLLAPGRSALDEQIVRLQRILENSATSEGDRIQRSADLAGVVSSSLLLHEVGAQVASIEEGLYQAAAAPKAKNLATVSTSLRQSVAILETLAHGLYAVDREGLLEEITKLQEFVTGRGGIVRTRQYDLDNIAHGQQLLGDAGQASRQLTAAIDQLVADAKGDIESASLDAESVQRFSTWVLIAAVALSLVSSTLIVWLYVGRNLIARLTALSNSMLAIAGGNLKADLPTGGKDEIGRMADALIVFRDTAVEVEETNLREIQETRRRLIDAIESISEGFSLFDSEDRLVLSNSMYSKFLYPGMDDVVTPGTPYESIIRRAAERGLITDAAGRIDEWVEWRLQQRRNPGEPHVQRRSSGTWIQVSERKTEDGGTVTVYTGITALNSQQPAGLVGDAMGRFG